ncbi:MAG: hypothetical protein AAF307_03395 [Pseudomonadota bacterium]
MDGISVPVHRLPAIRVLTLIERVVESSAEQTIAITRYADLPNGGIAGTDFCDVVVTTTFAGTGARGDVLGGMGIRLRPGLEAAAAYPVAWREATRRGQVLDLSAGCYAEIDLDDARQDAF